MSSVEDGSQGEPIPSSKEVDSNAQSFERPEFTLQNVLNDIIYGFKQLIFNPEFNKVIIPVLLAVESVAVKLIRGLVSCEYLVNAVFHALFLLIIEQ